jgi:hypothetical protein
MGDFRGGRGGTAGRESLSGGALPSGDERGTLLRFGVAVALAPAFRERTLLRAPGRSAVSSRGALALSPPFPSGSSLRLSPD